MSEVMIEARELVKRYDGVLALDKVSMKVRRGEVLGFLGPNGAGKSTTMKILTCFTSPTEGTREGQRPRHPGRLARRARAAIGYLPESNPLYPDMLVLEYLEFVAEMRGIDKARGAQAHQEGRRGDRPRRRVRQADPRALQGLSPARRPGAGADPRAADPDPRRADERPRPEPGGRDPRPDQGHRPRAHRHPVHAQPRRGAGRLQPRADHLQGQASSPTTRPTACATAPARAASSWSLLDARQRHRANARGGAARRRAASSACASSTTRRGRAALRGAARRGNDDLRPLLFKAAVDKGYTLVGLSREGQNLEQIFRELTTTDDDGAGKREQPHAPRQTDARAQLASSKERASCTERSPSRNASSSATSTALRPTSSICLFLILMGCSSGTLLPDQPRLGARHVRHDERAAAADRAGA